MSADDAMAQLGQFSFAAYGMRERAVLRDIVHDVRSAVAGGTAWNITPALRWLSDAVYTEIHRTGIFRGL